MGAKKGVDEQRLLPSAVSVQKWAEYEFSDAANAHETELWTSSQKKPIPYIQTKFDV